MKSNYAAIILIATVLFVSACCCLPGMGVEADLNERSNNLINTTNFLNNRSDKIDTYLKFWDVDSARTELEAVNAEVAGLKENISEICRITEENRDSLTDYSKFKRVCDGYSDYLNECVPSLLDVYDDMLEYTIEIDAALQSDIDETHLMASVAKCKTASDKYTYAAGSCQRIVNKYPEIINETYNLSEAREACTYLEDVVVNFSNSPYKKLYGYARGPGISCMYQKEIYPFLSKFSARYDIPLVECSIGNTGDDKDTYKLTVDVPGWSETSMNSMSIKPKEMKEFNQTVVFKQRLYENNEMTDGVMHMRVETSQGVVFETTKPIRIGSKNDFILIQDLEPLLVEWITPNDPEVIRIVSNAKEYMPGRAFTGYQSSTRSAQRESTIMQLNALYNALQDEGISYVNSIVSFNYMDSQRIRLPRESIQQRSANCIDGTVLFASLAENIGMNTYILLVPGHAYVAVEAYPGATEEDWVPIETTMIGTDSFEDSVNYAIEASNEVYSYQGGIVYVSTPIARELGITPMN